nr:UvrD-helicase domain-containing protein [Pseudomonas congelans]
MPLTAKQRLACIIDEDNNLVLAGAGTGKTSTTIGRVAFLVKSGQARPDEILLGVRKRRCQGNAGAIGVAPGRERCRGAHVSFLGQIDIATSLPVPNG